ncbi:hypothetical protein [Helicobacter sp. 23-1045]
MDFGAESVGDSAIFGADSAIFGADSAVFNLFCPPPICRFCVLQFRRI